MARAGWEFGTLHPVRSLDVHQALYPASVCRNPLLPNVTHEQSSNLVPGEWLAHLRAGHAVLQRERR
jgi:hypothetical protein